MKQENELARQQKTREKHQRYRQKQLEKDPEAFKQKISSQVQKSKKKKAEDNEDEYKEEDTTTPPCS